MKYVPPTGSTDLNAPYVGKNPAIGQQGSKVPPKAIEHTMREIVNVITSAGLTPSESDLGQLWEAIQAAIASGGTPDLASFKTVTSGPSSSPPVSPVAGDEALVADGATESFSGQARKIARYNGAAWVFTTCRVGRIFRVNATDTYHALTTGGWVSWTLPISAITNLQAALDGKVALNPAGGAAQTITGAGITIQGAWPSYGLQRASDAQDNAFYGKRANGNAMWGILLGEGTSDDFIINRWNVAGAYLDTPIRITYAGDTSIGVAGRTTTIQKSVVGDDRIELGVNNSGDRAAYIDFHASGAAGANDFSARILRNAGANGTLEFANTGTGGIALGSPVSLSGSLGASGNVAKSNGPGGPPAWASVVEIMGVRRAFGTYDNAALVASPTYVARGLGCSIAWVTDPVGAGPHKNVYATITFDTPLANANYTVSGRSLGIQSNGGATYDRFATKMVITGKTNAGFTVDITSPNSAHNITQAYFDIEVFV